MTKRAAAAATLAVLLALTGCRSSPTTPQSLSDAPPNEVSGLRIPDGRVEAAVARLDELADQLMRNSGIPGMAVAVVHGGKTLYAKGFGVKDVHTGDKVDADTVFQLASMSKPVGATVVAHQVTAGQIDWDTPVASKLPWFALSDPYVTGHVTVADLYSHRSGLPDHAGDRLEDLGYDRRQVLDRLRYLPLSPFRISYDYTNFGLTAAAEAVAAAAGKPWEDLCQEALYTPLGMTSTSSRYADFTARPDHAVGHVKVGDHYEPRYQRDPDAQSPAGGVSSSVHDTARWLATVMGSGSHDGKQIASPEALLPAVTPQVISTRAATSKARAAYYGHGFNVSVTSSGRTQYGHSGAFALGAATAFTVLPAEDVGIIALTNAAPVGVPETLAAEFIDLVQYGEIREDWAGLYRQAFAGMAEPEGALVGKRPPAHPAPAKPLNAYTGVYANDYWGPARITERDGKLMLTLGPAQHTVELTHWDGDIFTFALQNENA
ncbi:MAG TPA: serine hydrolase, partial [Mycobacterium sp.]|nr:serine hydrolase [Mycobacterium sp.]